MNSSTPSRHYQPSQKQHSFPQCMKPLRTWPITNPSNLPKKGTKLTAQDEPNLNEALSACQTWAQTQLANNNTIYITNKNAQYKIPTPTISEGESQIQRASAPPPCPHIHQSYGTTYTTKQTTHPSMTDKKQYTRCHPQHPDRKPSPKNTLTKFQSNTLPISTHHIPRGSQLHHKQGIL